MKELVRLLWFVKTSRNLLHRVTDGHSDGRADGRPTVASERADDANFGGKCQTAQD